MLEQVMFRFVFLFSAVVFALIIPPIISLHVVKAQTDDILQNNLLQEQSAICASYARLMEYSGLLKENQGHLWRERRFFAGAILRNSITEATGTQPKNGEIDSVINEYSGWMLDLFNANSVISDDEKMQEKDKLRDYIVKFCTGLFIDADKAIVKIKPELFASEINILPAQAHPDNTTATNTPHQVSNLLKENFRLQENLNNLKNKLAEQAAITPPQPESPSVKITTKTQPTADEKTDIIPGNTMMAPPRKPPLPLYLTAETGDIITSLPTEPIGHVGLTQVELASYSTINKANHGLNILTKALPEEMPHVKLHVAAARLSSGRNIFRVVSAPISLENAKDICTFFWNRQYACIIKADSSS
jgi:hypothetical protein